MSAPEVVAEVSKPATTYEWLGSLPLAASAGNTVYSWYEGTKNCCRVSQFAIGTVESTVKYAADAAAPIVKRLDKPSKWSFLSFTTNNDSFCLSIWLQSKLWMRLPWTGLSS